MPIEQQKMDAKRIKELVDEVSERENDPFVIDNKDPSKAYYWGNIEPKRLERLKAQGWEIVSDSNLKTRGRKEGTTHILGDVIAMHRPKELSEALKKRRLEEAARRRTRKNEELKEEISKLGKGIRYTQDKDDTE